MTNATRNAFFVFSVLFFVAFLAFQFTALENSSNLIVYRDALFISMLCGVSSVVSLAVALLCEKPKRSSYTARKHERDLDRIRRNRELDRERAKSRSRNAF